MGKYKIIDICSGGGGFSLAAKESGFETFIFCEKGSYAKKILKKRFPNVPIHNKIETFHRKDYENKIKTSDKFILTGGLPCQPYSRAGKRRGVKDPRYLWQHTYRILREFSPAWFVFENVSGILSMEIEQATSEWLQLGMESQIYSRKNYNRFFYRKRQLNLFNKILEDFEKRGYAVQPFIIPACSIKADHKRDRVWIIGRRLFNDTNSDTDNKKQERARENDSLQELHRKEVRAWLPTGAIKPAYVDPWRRHEEKIKPIICREDYGVSEWLDIDKRIKVLGNAIVWQIPHLIFEVIKEVEKCENHGNQAT